MNRITDSCKNITFPQLRLRAVKMKVRYGISIVLLLTSSCKAFSGCVICILIPFTTSLAVTTFYYIPTEVAQFQVRRYHMSFHTAQGLFHFGERLTGMHLQRHYRPQTKLRKGNVFTGVCLVTGEGVGNIKSLIG